MKEITVINSSSLKFLPIVKQKKAVAEILRDFSILEYSINIVYLDNKAIEEMNVEFLKHNYPTDVITFEIEKEPLLAEIYIGAEVAKEQAREYKVSLRNEILRLGIHGTLHLCGLNDKTDEEKAKMTQKENEYLG